MVGGPTFTNSRSTDTSIQCDTYPAAPCCWVSIKQPGPGRPPIYGRRPSTDGCTFLNTLYRVIQNFASPSRAENRQASAKLTISPSNTFNLNPGKPNIGF